MRMRAMLRRLIETLGLRSEEARSRLTELEHLLEESAAIICHTHERQHFAKVRPLPVQTGKTSKHGGAG